MVLERAGRKPNWTGEIRLLWRQKLNEWVVSQSERKREENIWGSG